MKYAKLINHYPSFAPNPILVGANWIGNPPGEVYENEGYKPVTFTDQPEAPAGYDYAETWTEDAEGIYQGWALVEETDASPDEALEFLFGGET